MKKDLNGSALHAWPCEMVRDMYVASAHGTGSTEKETDYGIITCDMKNQVRVLRTGSNRLERRSAVPLALPSLCCCAALC